ncbi:hypothetical protein [Ralstonia solanacearum]|uniref:hypothetical protein n=1 Tax=Ralstonia solanacearum TaxID=305 RepID=UPI001E2AC176|nr:hypothetical protein [Ralstonia solanacearum]
MAKYELEFKLQVVTEALADRGRAGRQPAHARGGACPRMTAGMTAAAMTTTVTSSAPRGRRSATAPGGAPAHRASSFFYETDAENRIVSLLEAGREGLKPHWYRYDAADRLLADDSRSWNDRRYSYEQRTTAPARRATRPSRRSCRTR